MNVEGSENEAPDAGYRIDQIYSVQRTIEAAGEDSELLDESGHFEIIWDWRIPDVDQALEAIERDESLDRLVFEVALGVEVPASTERPENIKTLLVGRFELGGGQPSVPLLQFAKLHAVALVYPYLRQAVSELSEMSPREAYLLPILNVSAMMDDFDMELSSGWAQLQERPDLAGALGIEIPDPE